MALHIGIGNFGGAIASNIYRAQAAPRYILGRECLPTIPFFLLPRPETNRWTRNM